MSVIALVNSKGGAGKTSLASNLAVAALEAGKKVYLIDIDPQASLLGWLKIRKSENLEGDTISPSKLEAALTVLKELGYNVIVIDTPGSDSPATAAAMKVADLCLIPVRPSAFDIRATEKTRDTLKTLNKDFYFVLNQCPAGSNNSRTLDGARALQLMGNLIGPMIANRVDFQTSAISGLGVTEVNPNGKAAVEIKELWTAISKRLDENNNGKISKIA